MTARQDDDLPTTEGDEPREELLDRLFGEYVDRLNAGERIDVSELLNDHPDVGLELFDQLMKFQDATFLDDAAAETLGTLGDYTLRRQIGRGGMGVVYDAWQNSLERRVALKVLPPGIAADNRSFVRFMREAKTAAQLSHPNVVGVHSVGLEKDTPYYSMELVEGETLAQIIAEIKTVAPETETPFGRQDGQDYYIHIARCFADVADGLQHAHSRSVIHRDIKPSNLILDEEGRLRILDFGLARLEGQESLTISGSIVGTPLYMSPEQAREKKIHVDHRTDIYSLGATMYELICGLLPFKGKNHHDTLTQIIEREPVEPRKLNPRVPKDLETIVLKCLRKDPKDRYGTAEAMGQDLRRFVRGDFVEAKPPEKWKKWARWAIRNRWRAAVSMVVAVALFLCGLAYHFYREGQRKTSGILNSPAASISDPISWLKDNLRIADAKQAADHLWRGTEHGEQDSSLWTIWLALTLSDLRRPPAELLEKVRSLGPQDDGSSRVRWAEWLLENLAEGKPLRINCGYFPKPDQPDHIELAGEDWFRDCFFRGGAGSSAVQSVQSDGKDKSVLYRTARFWPRSGGYSIPLPAGRYLLRLHFVQTRVTEPGDRVFDVYVDGREFLQDYDTLLSVGYARADMKEVKADVHDGILDIEFKTKAGNSVLSGLEIERLK